MTTDDDKTPAEPPKGFIQFVQRHKAPIGLGLVAVATLPLANSFSEAGPCGRPGLTQCQSPPPDEPGPRGSNIKFIPVPALTHLSTATGTLSPLGSRVISSLSGTPFHTFNADAL